jgi:hypothetical protein
MDYVESIFVGLAFLFASVAPYLNLDRDQPLPLGSIHRKLLPARQS